MTEQRPSIGIIGGSGIYQIEGIEIVEEHLVETPFGSPSDKIIEAKIEGTSFYFMPRHRRDHHYLPHEINYRANIYAMKKCGVDKLISVSAVGSLREELPPRTLVFVDQFIDWTKGQRNRSFFGEGIVAHVSAADPVEKNLQQLMAKHAKKLELEHAIGGSYLCIEGPQFSTRAESQIYRSFGASVIGMTNVPEAYLAKEAGMAYATVAMVTDYDCWKEEHCTVDEIMKVMKDNNQSAQKLLKSLLPELSEAGLEFKKENAIGVMTPVEKLNAQQKEILDVLLK